MSSLRTHRRGARRLATRLVAVIGVLALVPAAAEAHVLSKGRAMRAVKAEALHEANDLRGETLDDDDGVVAVESYGWGGCVRRSAHAFLCLIDSEGTVTYSDGTVIPYACGHRVRVGYRTHGSRRPSVAALGERTCVGQPEGGAADGRFGPIAPLDGALGSHPRLERGALTR